MFFLLLFRGFCCYYFLWYFCSMSCSGLFYFFLFTYFFRMVLCSFLFLLPFACVIDIFIYLYNSFCCFIVSRGVCMCVILFVFWNILLLLLFLLYCLCFCYCIKLFTLFSFIFTHSLTHSLCWRRSFIVFLIYLLYIKLFGYGTRKVNLVQLYFFLMYL